MAYAEKRGNLWRARWRGPDGTWIPSPDSGPVRPLRTMAVTKRRQYGTTPTLTPGPVRSHLPNGSICGIPALDLELTTLSTYRYTIEVHILPAFGHRSLASLETEEIATWEMQLITEGY